MTSLTKNFTFKFLAILAFLIPPGLSSLELTIAFSIVLFLVFIADFEFKYSLQVVYTVLALILIIAVGTVSSILGEVKPYDFFRDLSNMAKPIFFIVSGYYLSSKIEDKSFIPKAILYVAIFFAVLHLYRAGLFMATEEFSIHKLRNLAGKANFVELIALVLLVANSQLKRINLKVKYQKAILMLLLVSFVFYFSRTMVLGFLILFLGALGYLKLTKKGFVILSSLVLGVILMFSYLYTIDLDREADGFEGFLYKIKIAPSEIFTTKIDISNHAELWDHWRGYEAGKALSQLDNTSGSLGYFIGRGIGAQVDLDFKAPLRPGGIRFIPITHNGYVYIIFKTGIIGLIIYLLLLVYLYLFTYKNTNDRSLFFDRLVSSLAVYFFFTSFIITGIYNQDDILTICLGAFLYYRHYYLHHNPEGIPVKTTG